MWSRKRQYPATITGGARATEGSEPRPSHRERRHERQGQRQPPMTAVNAVTSKRGPPRGTRARTDAGKPMETPCYRCEGKHAPRDCRFKDAVCHSCKKRGHPARVCRSKRTVGMVMPENSRSRRTHLKVKRAVRVGKRATSVHPIPCELSTSQPDRSFSDGGRNTDDDGARHRGSGQCYQ